MSFSYAVPARRFYRSPVIDERGLRYEADRSLAENVRLLAMSEWGAARAGTAEDLARLVSAADPTADRAPHARRWAAAILCATVGGGRSAPETLALVENRTGVTPTETAARLHDLTALLSSRPAPADGAAYAPPAR